MSTSYPTDLDTLTNPTSTDTLSSVSHTDQHSNANDAVEAIEAKVGKDNSAVTTSHDYKLSAVTGSDKALGRADTATVTNKTLTSPVLNTGVSGTAVLDEDDLVSDSDTKVATQQSIKAYVDAAGGVNTSGTPVSNDIARFTDADTIEGRSYAEVKGDLNLEIGTDVLAQQTIGIANDNLVETDSASVASGEYAKFTANGLESKSFAEVRGDINVEDNADVTDTANVTSAGALMDSELASIADVKALNQSVISGATPTFTNTNFTEAANKNYVTDAEATVIGNTSGTNTGDEPAADLTTPGIVELATIAETDTGTDATRAATPDGIQGSLRNLRFMYIALIDSATDDATDTTIGGDWVVPVTGTIVQDDSNPDYFAAYTDTAGTTGTMVVDVHLNGTTIMDTNKLDIETTEKDTTTAATQPDLTTTAVTKGDILTIDIDAVHSGTAAKGLKIMIAIRPN